MKKPQVNPHTHEIGVFDVSEYLNDKYWSGLKNPAIFRTAKVSGGSVEWKNGVDFCPDELYQNSKIIGKQITLDLSSNVI